MLINKRSNAFFFMELSFNAPKIRKNHDSQHDAASRGEVLCAVGRLFLFHQGFDFLGFHGVDVTIGIAEAEGAIVAAAHGEQALHGEVEATHQLLGEGGYFILLGIHCYCCHIL